MKVALVCDWLTNVGGAEKVLLQLHQMYPEAPIYTSKYAPKKIDWFRDAEVRTGWLQIFPTGMRRLLGPLRMRWFSHLDLSGYDLVISVTGAEAKAVKTFDVKTGRRARHISYCHVPTQYYWQMYDDYVRDPGFGVLNPLIRACFKLLVRGQRKKDFTAAASVDEFVTISEYARKLIAKYYRRTAKVIHPPVDITNFSTSCIKSQEGGEGAAAACPSDTLRAALAKSSCSAEHVAATPPPFSYYIITSRQVTWKRIDLAVKACKKLGRELLVIGEGPEHDSLVKMAKDAPCVRFLPLMRAGELASYLHAARGYIFPSLEPFGIAPVEALAAGCPVIAYGEGGALDYVKDGENGVLFDKRTVKSVCGGILRFEKMKFDRGKVVKSAEGFGAERFEKEIREMVAESMQCGKVRCRRKCDAGGKRRCMKGGK